MIDEQILLSNTTTTVDLKFWVPIFVTIALAIWNLYQQRLIINLKREKEKQLHIHKLQFEKEFGIYNELWAKLVELKIIIAKLRPQLDSIEPDKTYEETIESRLGKAADIGNNTIKVIEKNKPFYAKEVYSELKKIIELIKTEFIEVKHGNRNTKEYWKEGQENLKELEQLTDKVCEAIRDRIGIIETK